MLPLSPLPFAAILDVTRIVTLVIPVAGMVLGGAIAITAMYFKHQQRRLWHEMARTALEKGQPIPEYAEGERLPRLKPRPQIGHDVRGGLVLVAVGAAIYLFFVTVGAPEARFVGAIPGFIGVALLLYAALNALFSKSNTPPESRS